jgi:hypothetical protein
MALPQTTTAPAPSATTTRTEPRGDDRTQPLATLTSLPRHTIALAAIAATVGAMIGYDLFLLGWGSALIGAGCGAAIGSLMGIGVTAATHRHSGLLADEFPRGHMLLVVTDEALDVHERSIITGRPGHRLRRYGRHQLTAVGFQKQLLTTVLAIRFSDGSTLHQDTARWAKVEDFVHVLTR